MTHHRMSLSLVIFFVLKSALPNIVTTPAFLGLQSAWYTFFDSFILNLSMPLYFQCVFLVIIVCIGLAFLWKVLIYLQQLFTWMSLNLPSWCLFFLGPICSFISLLLIFCLSLCVCVLEFHCSSSTDLLTIPPHVYFFNWLLLWKSN